MDPNLSVPSGGILDPLSSRSLGRTIQDRLGQHLHALYEEPAPSALPDALAELAQRVERAVTGRGKANLAEFHDGVLKALPRLRAFAISLTRAVDRADDLVQGTVLRAYEKRAHFQPQTDLDAWLFTILRNRFFSEYRRRTREMAASDGTYAMGLVTASDQMDNLNIQDLQAALDKLRPDQRQALLLAGVEGLSYEEVAAICGTAVGTIKSRVHRARARLAELMGHTAGELGSHRVGDAGAKEYR